MFWLHPCFTLGSAATAWTNVATPTTQLDWIISTQDATAGFGTILAQASNQLITSSFFSTTAPLTATLTFGITALICPRL